MHILFIVPYVPGPIYVRPYNLIRSLSNLGNKITVLTVAANESDRQAAENLRRYCEKVYEFPLPAWRSILNCALALPTQAPLQASYCWQPDLVKYAIQLMFDSGAANPFDVIHVEHLRGARFGLALKAMLSAQPRDKSQMPPIVWDSVDCITHLFSQTASYADKKTSKLMARFELSRTARYEGWLCSQFSHVFVTSNIDKEALLSLTDRGDNPPDISVIPNGVDLVHFSPHNVEERESDTVVLSGKMSYHANISMTLWMMREIMPLIWSKKAGVKVWIVGKDPSPAIQALGRNPLVTVTGMVQDISVYLKRASVAVAPLRYGAGIQNKVLEAMACGTPVVTNSQALRSLSAVPGKDLLIADDPQAFARQVLYLIENESERKRIGESGREYVEDKHNWDNIALQLENIYKSLKQDYLEAPLLAIGKWNEH